jgi:tripartite-type tricarboxylate transporter receptor subunit TctC
MKKLIVLAFAALFATPALAAYPDKPITMICATSPGSGASRWCQMMAQGLAKKDALGVPVRVVFKPGGSGNEAAVYADNKPADGYTLMHANGSYSGYMNLPTFSVKRNDLTLVARIVKSLYVVVTPADSKYKSFADVVKAAKAEPGKLPVAGNKLGSNAHRQIISLFNAAGVKVNHIPYHGTGKSLKDLLGHHIMLGLSNPSLVIPHIKAGALRALVLLDTKRLPEMPNVPTPHDLGLNYDLPVQWQGFFLKTGTPPAVKQKILKAMATVVHSQEFKAYLKKTPGVVENFITDEAALNKDLDKNIKATREFMKENGLI